MGLDVNPKDKTLYTPQDRQALLKYVDTEYFAKHRHVPVNKHKSVLSNNLFPSAKATGLGESSVHRYDLFNDHKE
jgi:hypothetical protein